ncbi:MAG: aminopeptidase [Clostridia bacterium]|nr:aminopeptidase [Clostridia bacterium]
MKATILRKYASLIARKGVNITKGDDVIIMAELDQPKFVEYVVDECYKAGARQVTVEWSHQPLQKLHVRHRSLKTLSKVEDWEIKRFEHYIDRLPARIWLESSDPDGLNGMNFAKYAKGTQARSKIIKPLRDQMENKYKWCIAAIPGKKWAKKLFPDLTPAAAVEKLWEAILYASRADGDDPIKAWEDHNKNLKGRCDYLNSLGIESLHYTSKNGTDFTVGMIGEALFCGGSEDTQGKGETFEPNIPSEEVFVSPMRGKAEGIVYSTKPLSYNGQLIENFSVRFENGKAVEVKAEKNEELLRTMINMDEGASYLGEVALVPYSSPINKLGFLFYNTLFDENAACHLALGRGFTNTLRDYDKYTFEEQKAMGVNDSIIHEDFMIGSDDLDIVATTRDGKKVQIFKNGEWAF